MVNGLKMTLYEQKEQIEQIIQTLSISESNLILSIKSLVNYIDIEVYNENSEEDAKVCNLIQKKTDLFCKKLQEALKDIFEEGEEIEFKKSRNSLEKYEPIIYLFGFKKEGETKNSEFKKACLRGFVEDENSFLIIVDIFNGSKLIPWKI